MKTVRNLLYRDVLWSVFFVTIFFVALFFFIDFVDEMSRVGRNGYTMGAAALAVLLEQPGHVYELFPIAVLIGTIYSMARLAQSSEFTILRTAGLGPGRALSLLGVIGLLFAVLTFSLGEYVTPHSEQAAGFLKARFGLGLAIGRTGVRIYEMDSSGREVRSLSAEHAIVPRARNVSEWTLQDVTETTWIPRTATSDPRVEEKKLPTMNWPTKLNASVAAAALLPVQSMGAVALWRYSTHLAEQEQSTQTYRIQFWKRVLYPFACLVMVALALPFAYLHARAGGVSVKVFGGIMLGISFVLLNNVAGHLGMLHEWTPWIAASVPSVVYLLMSMSAFAWLVRYR
jgi:lipopolysaccharide export system permease protein